MSDLVVITIIICITLIILADIGSRNDRRKKWIMYFILKT